ncbi:MAG TPA: hypothetical protein GYA07_12755 [Verrucomicrobia bacterium]|nr:hypothetical protein [Verrucomicrobiota bacterium]HOP98954.1 hypothetical protein [Verrucomicrobiota bacterium]HPU54964.1 hypothetical protein [Verrucomicrobiota bacterium]
MNKKATKENLQQAIAQAAHIAAEAGEQCYIHMEKPSGPCFSDECSDSPFMVGVKPALATMIRPAYLNLVGTVAPDGTHFINDFALLALLQG